MVAFDRYAYGIARSVHALPSFLAGNQFDVTTPLKPFPTLGEEKKGPGPVGFQPLIPKAKFLASPFLPPIPLEARCRRHSHSPPPLLHLRKTLAADPSNPPQAPKSRPQSS